ncbi:MAG TPA: hypothetical protein VM118_11455 [Acidobacteriota bacterium]|nr:hypothetical protein [Acidobacteriota bacterium]
MKKSAREPADPQEEFALLVEDLDADVEDLEDLLDVFEKQNKKLTAQIQSVSRQISELQSEFVELRETLESVIQRLDRQRPPVSPCIDP